MTQADPVLIVDDEVHIRTYLRLTCEKHLRVAVVEAPNAREALRICGETTPRLILLDINMPGMSGTVAAARLRALLPSTPILMLTVRASRGVVKECLDAGASAYLRKDTPIDQFLSVLREFLQEEAGETEAGDQAGNSSDANFSGWENARVAEGRSVVSDLAGEEET